MSDQDQDENDVYAAVGRALSMWETLEAALSYTYSIFEERPIDYDLLESYGREAKIFKDRMATLERAAEKYFRFQPNQNEECRFAAFIAEAKRLSTFRNQIAHGIVIGKENYASGIYYVLVPPSHGYHHLTKRDGLHYNYGSSEIDAFAGSFIELGRAVQMFNHERHPPDLT
jgi:hypothetical protein